MESKQSLLILSMLLFLFGYLWIQAIKNKFIGTVLIIVGFIGVAISLYFLIFGG